MRELALFAGAGGSILTGKLLGWRTVCAVEKDETCRKILLTRMLDDGILEKFPLYSDVREFDGKKWKGKVDVITAGFPCRDISAAGKGGGIENGKESGLWKEAARVIGEVRPPFVFIENSPLITTRGLDIVLRDLAALGFNAEWDCIGADSVGAVFHRPRFWLVGLRPGATESTRIYAAGRGLGKSSAVWKKKGG